MAFDQFVPATNSQIQSAPLRANFNALKALVDDCPTRGERQAAISDATATVRELQGTDPLNLTISNPPTQAQVQAINRCSAGFQTCCIADFQIGGASERRQCPRVRKPAIQQTWKSALRFHCEASGLEVLQGVQAVGRAGKTFARGTGGV